MAEAEAGVMLEETVSWNGGGGGGGDPFEDTVKVPEYKYWFGFDEICRKSRLPLDPSHIPVAPLFKSPIAVTVHAGAKLACTLPLVNVKPSVTGPGELAALKPTATAPSNVIGFGHPEKTNVMRYVPAHGELPEHEKEIWADWTCGEAAVNAFVEFIEPEIWT